MPRNVMTNLKRDGYTAVANRIVAVVSGQRGAHVVTVRPDGGVFIVRHGHYSKLELDVLVKRTEFVGIYKDTVAIQDIEEIH
jgi:hypothetical protein